MPYPSQIDRETILETARAMIEQGGVQKLSLNKLAAELGVKTPSLYRYVKNRADLLRAVNEQTQTDLFAALHSALDSDATTPDKILPVARAYWDFAHANPATYGLLFTNTIPDLRPDEDSATLSVLPFQAVMAEIAGEANALPALRGLLALMHGFVMLVLAGQLRRGGDLQAAYLESVRAYVRGWSETST